MTEVEDGEVIRTGGCRVAAIFNGVLDLGGGEGICAMVEWVLSSYLFEGASRFWTGAVGDWSGELVAEVGGDDLGFGVDLIVEVDGLVGVLVGARPRQVVENLPVLS